MPGPPIDPHTLRALREGTSREVAKQRNFAQMYGGHGFPDLADVERRTYAAMDFARLQARDPRAAARLQLRRAAVDARRFAHGSPLERHLVSLSNALFAIERLLR